MGLLNNHAPKLLARQGHFSGPVFNPKSPIPNPPFSPHRLHRLRRSGGAVMVLVLLAMILLAALLFYVMNLGRQVNARVVTQHSADVAAISGAGWIARSLNTVAMNNVAISRYLATINTLDAMPLATHAALGEQTALHTAILVREPTFTMNSPVVNAFAHEEAQRLLQELTEEVQTLTDADTFYNANDVGLMTRYQNANGPGSLWNAMTTLDQFSQATMENLGTLAALNTERGGAVNLPPDNDPAALLAPTPDIPWKRGTFNDFQMPLTRGRLPAAVDNDTTNRGPYDTVFGWRSGWHGRGGGGGISYTSGPSSPFGAARKYPSVAAAALFLPSRRAIIKPSARRIGSSASSAERCTTKAARTSTAAARLIGRARCPPPSSGISGPAWPSNISP